MVGNLVSGKRIAQASGRDLGQIEDNDQARKVSVRPGCSLSPMPTGCCVTGCRSPVYHWPLGPADVPCHLTRKMCLLGVHRRQAEAWGQRLGMPVSSWRPVVLVSPLPTSPDFMPRRPHGNLGARLQSCNCWDTRKHKFKTQVGEPGILNTSLGAGGEIWGHTHHTHHSACLPVTTTQT